MSINVSKNFSIVGDLILIINQKTILRNIQEIHRIKKLTESFIHNIIAFIYSNSIVKIMDLHLTLKCVFELKNQVVILLAGVYYSPEFLKYSAATFNATRNFKNKILSWNTKLRQIMRQSIQYDNDEIISQVFVEIHFSWDQWRSLKNIQ